MNPDILARIDAALVILDRAHKMSISSLEAANDATLYGFAAVVLREARALIPTPPTDDEREALCEIIDAVDEGRIDGQVELWENIFPLERDQIVDAIMASPVWRNRGRGPITESVIDLAYEAFVAGPRDAKASMRAALEAARDAEAGS